jgi:sugar transferase (PEP-CTERM system associated)
LKASHFNSRTALLIVSETALMFAVIVGAVCLRVGLDGADYELVEKHGYLKAAFAAVLCLTAFYLFDLYDFDVMHDRQALLLRLVQALGLTWIGLALAFYAFPALRLGRSISLIALPMALALMAAWRISVHWFFGHPQFGERLLIVGVDEVAIEVARPVLERPDAGYRIAGFIGTDPEMIGKSLINPKVIGLTKDVAETVKREGINRIIVALGEERAQLPIDELLRLSLRGEVSIEEAGSFFERVTGRVSLNMISSSWLIFTSRGRQPRLATIVRRLLHRLFALIGLVISLPLSLVIAVLIKLDSAGPVFYRQERVGQNGHTFVLLKFRSMKLNAEESGPVWASKHDERTTRVGRLIRKLRLDEIPQFWNILRGDMNFVGPRPERPHFVAQLAQEIRYYDQRHLIPPGLTGWAQIKYPYAASVADAREKLQYDLFYVKNHGLFLDAIILFETVKIILLGRGAQ